METNKIPGAFRNFIAGYGHFPYIDMHVSYAIYMQIPIHLIKEGEKGDITTQPGTHLFGVSEEVFNLSQEKQIEILHERLLDLAKQIKRKIENDRDFEFWICLVEGENKAYYLEDDNVRFSTSIPTGGTLITQGNEWLAMHMPHYLTKNQHLEK